MANSMTYTGDLDLWTHDCRIAADRVLKELGLAASVTNFDRTRTWTYRVPAITAEQYGQVVEALKPIGRMGTDWKFSLDEE